MSHHWLYLKYVLRHKFWVFVAARRMGLGFWAALIHDHSKFYPDEWFPYARWFYSGERNGAAFSAAWARHIRRNKHHWQYWDGQPMPVRHLKEMIADWMGAGRAITGGWDYLGWYAKEQDKMVLHPDTRELVELWLQKLR